MEVGDRVKEASKCMGGMKSVVFIYLFIVLQEDSSRAKQRL